MIEQTDRLRVKLGRPGPLIGTWVCSPNPDIVEMLGHAGFDFAILDLEHGMMGIDSLAGLFRAAEVSALSAMVRIPAASSDLIANAIDAGAAGIIVPAVTSVDTGKAAIAATRFPPHGARGAHNSTRALKYSALAFSQLLTGGESRPVVAIQIESVLDDETLEGLMMLDGLDIAFVGAYDLSTTMGLAGQFDHADVIAQVDRIVASARRHGVSPGIWTPGPESVPGLVDRGFTFLTLSNSELIFFQNAARIANAARAQF